MIAPGAAVAVAGTFVASALVRAVSANYLYRCPLLDGRQEYLQNAFRSSRCRRSLYWHPLRSRSEAELPEQSEHVGLDPSFDDLSVHNSREDHVLDFEGLVLSLDAVQEIYGFTVDEEELRARSEELKRYYQELAQRIESLGEGEQSLATRDYPEDRMFM